jgi:prepilin-type processing-associated H-X9-DG protein
MNDGPANTLLLVEVVGSGIHWAEPRDLTIDQIAPTVNSKSGFGVSSRHIGGAHGLMADGRVVFLSDKLAPATIRGLLTIDGGENVSP